MLKRFLPVLLALSIPMLFAEFRGHYNVETVLRHIENQCDHFSSHCLSLIESTDLGQCTGKSFDTDRPPLAFPLGTGGIHPSFPLHHLPPLASLRIALAVSSLISR